MNIPLHILYFHSDDPIASKYVRVLEPLGLLVSRGHRITSFESLNTGNRSVEWPVVERALSECNILLISNVDITPPNFEVFKRMVTWCNQHKKLIIYDFDDLYDQVPESNPFRNITLKWDFVKEVIALAHVLTVTGKELQQTLSAHHSRIVIVPNMVDCRRYLPRPRDHSRLRIGWAGGITHLADLPLIADGVRQLQKKYSFEFIILGMFPNLIQFTKNTELIRSYSIHPEELTEPFHKAYVNFARNLEGIEYQAVPATGYPEFPKALAGLDLDIGLCPIHDNLFNRCRSAIKFYQYAAVQTASLASNVYPYSEEPVVLAENTSASWFEKLETLVGDRHFREETTRLQYEHVRDNRNHERNGSMWEILYQELIQKFCR